MELLTGVVSIALIVLGTPSAAHSTFPKEGVYLVGLNSGHSPPTDAAGEFEVTIHTATELPLQGVTVSLNLNACAPDIRISRIQSFTGVSVVCNGERGVVVAQTDQQGKVRFRILGGAANTSAGVGAGFKCAQLRANNVFLSDLTVAALDQTGGLDGALPNDLSVAIADVNDGSLAGRSDFNFDGVLLPNDLSLMISFVNSNRSQQNTSAPCP